MIAEKISPEKIRVVYNGLDLERLAPKEIDRRKINLKDTIKEIGDYTAKVKLYRDVTIDIPVKVSAEGATATPAKPETAETEE